MESLDKETLDAIKGNAFAMELLESLYLTGLTGATPGSKPDALKRIIGNCPEFRPTHDLLERAGLISMEPEAMPLTAELGEKVAKLLEVTERYEAYQARKAEMYTSCMPNNIGPTLTNIPYQKSPLKVTFTTDGTVPSPTPFNTPTSTPELPEGIEISHTCTMTPTPTSIDPRYKNQNPEKINRTPKNLEYSIRENPIECQLRKNLI